MEKIQKILVGDKEYEINAKYWGGLVPSDIESVINDLTNKVDDLSNTIQVLTSPDFNDNFNNDFSNYKIK